MFIDSATVHLRAGKGGDGVIAWRREKYIPKGGPSGGDGGNGGSIWIKTDPHTHSLEPFRNRRQIFAEHGNPGEGNRRKGKHGETLVLSVPCGTLIKRADTKEVLFDFTKEGQEFLICQGGKGGLGNCHFKSPTNQAPHICTKGTIGEEIEIEMELKLIADIGLIGMPNAGKSTLLSALTPVRVKIGAYPFTTLYPNLGYVYYEGGDRTLLADIPGLIENAHLNKGLGFAFLRHVERSAALLFVIDVSGWEGRHPFDDFAVLRKELEAYRPELLEKPFFVVLNKLDQEGADLHLQDFIERYPFDKTTLFPISAIKKEGLESLKNALKTLIGS
ncbi:MAG: GTPase obg [Chlamydiota bacterium]|jgi:GTP-binding protein